MQRRAISSQGQRSNFSGSRNAAQPQKVANRLPKLLANGDMSTQAIEQSGLDVGVSSQQGKRPYQEDEFSIRPSLKSKSNSSDGNSDTHFFGLFDGHAGGRCSKFVSTNLPDILAEDNSFTSNLPQAVKRTFFNANDQFLQIAERMKLHDGSTGICSIVRDGKVLVSNVGDCRCIILSNGKPIQMSVDQKPTAAEEQRRIASLGGTVVMCMGTARVNGVLAVSRAFGNRTLKQVIRPDPELSMREFTKDDDYLIMASDGLWDVLRNVDVCHIAYSCAHQTQNPHQAMQLGLCQSIAEELVHSALSRGSMDNVTCICVRISGPHGLYQNYQNSRNGNHHGAFSQPHGMVSGAGSSSTSPYPGQEMSTSNARSTPVPSNPRSLFSSSSPASFLSNSNNGSNNNSNSSGIAGGGSRNNAGSAGNDSTVVDMLSAIMSSTSGGERNRSNASGTNFAPNVNGPNNNGQGRSASAVGSKKSHVYTNNFTSSRMNNTDIGSSNNFGEMKASMDANANNAGGMGSSGTGLAAKKTPGLGSLGKSQSMKRMSDLHPLDDDMTLSEQHHSIVLDGAGGNAVSMSNSSSSGSKGAGSSVTRFMASSSRLRDNSATLNNQHNHVAYAFGPSPGAAGNNGNMSAGSNSGSGGGQELQRQGPGNLFASMGPGGYNIAGNGGGGYSNHMHNHHDSAPSPIMPMRTGGQVNMNHPQPVVGKRPMTVSGETKMGNMPMIYAPNSNGNGNGPRTLFNNSQQQQQGMHSSHHSGY